MAKIYILFGTINASFCVILGAFAAHKLKTFLSEGALATFQTGVQYHFYHSFALLLLGIVMLQLGSQSAFLKYSGIMFMLGVFLFCGSLYGLSFATDGYFQGKWLGPITPIGGLCFVTAWILMAMGVIKNA